MEELRKLQQIFNQEPKHVSGHCFSERCRLATLEALEAGVKPSDIARYAKVKLSTIYKWRANAATTTKPAELPPIRTLQVTDQVSANAPLGERAHIKFEGTLSLDLPVQAVASLARLSTFAR